MEVIIGVIVGFVLGMYKTDPKELKKVATKLKRNFTKSKGRVEEFESVHEVETENRKIPERLRHGLIGND